MGSNPFKSKTKTYVSSGSSNVQGNFEDRGSFLITTLLGSIIGKPTDPLAESVTECYVKSPGVTLPSWLKNVQINNLYGLPTSTVTAYDTPPANVVEEIIPDSSVYDKAIQASIIGAANYAWWAEQYMLENHSDLYETAWTSDIDENLVVTITFADLSTASFTPTDYDSDSTYLYALYYYSKSDDVISNDIIEQVDNSTSLPDLTGYSLESTNTVSEPVTLTTTVTTTKSYSDGRPDEITIDTSDTTGSGDTTTEVHTKVNYTTDLNTGTVVQNTYTLTAIYTYIVDVDTTTEESSEVIEGVTVTTTVVTETEVIVDGLDNSWTVGLEVKTIQENTTSKIVIYRFGSNLNANVEALRTSETNNDTIFPVLPLRIHNKSLSHVDYEDEYAKVDKVYRLATGRSIQTILDAVEDTNNLGDMDFIALHYGVALNTPRKECKEYLLRFFQTFGTNSINNPNAVDAFLAEMGAYSDYKILYDQWVEDVENGLATADDMPIAPNSGAITSMAKTEVKIKGAEEADFYNIRLVWDYLSQEVVSGSLIDSESNPLPVGEIMIVAENVEVDLLNAKPITEELATGETEDPDRTTTATYDATVFYKQLTEDTYLIMRIGGLVFKNHVYKGKYVELTGREGLGGEDGDTTIEPSEEDTGFIVPLHYDILMQLTLVERAQICSEAQFITVNSYKRVKQKWYQTSLFKIIVMIIIIVISVYYPPAGAASSGVLGTSAAVGAALGFTGTAALIAGAIANAVAAIIVSAIINRVAVELFGEKYGAIIGAIASIAVTAGLSSYSSTGSFAFNVAELSLSQMTLYGLQLGNSAMQAYAADQIEELEAKAGELAEDYENTMERIADLTNEYLNPNNTQADVNGIISSFIYDRIYTNEHEELSLLTSTDIKEISDAIVYDFVELTTQLNV